MNPKLYNGIKYGAIGVGVAAALTAGALYVGFKGFTDGIDNIGKATMTKATLSEDSNYQISEEAKNFYSNFSKKYEKDSINNKNDNILLENLIEDIKNDNVE